MIKRIIAEIKFEFGLPYDPDIPDRIGMISLKTDAVDREVLLNRNIDQKLAVFIRQNFIDLLVSFTILHIGYEAGILLFFN